MLVYVLSGPGGVGKGTLLELVLAARSDVQVVRSWTTRSRRPSESSQAYRFIDRSAFEAAIAAGELLEWNEFQGNLYGTPARHGCDSPVVVFEIDVNGAAKLIDRFGAAAVRVIFVDADDETIRARLRKRGETGKYITGRLEIAQMERRMAAGLNAIWIWNDSLADATATLDSVLEPAKQASENRP